MSDSEISVILQLDAIANKFEEQWSPDQRAAIKPFLERIDEQHRDKLLRILLDVDVELRSKAGQRVSADN